MLTVTTGADTADRVCGAHCSLRAAITVANALPGPDHLALPAGTVTLSIAGANENANASGDLDVTSDLVISGAGADRTLIDAQRLDRVLHVRNASLELEDLQLRRGRAVAGDGGGVAVQGGALTLRRVLVRDCASDNWGGRVYVGAGDLLIEASTLADNRAERGGGLYFQGFSRQLTIDNSTISGNLASAGGGIFVDQEYGFANTCAITSSTIADNRGGGLRNVAGAFALALGNDLLAGNAGGNCAPGSGHSLGHDLDDDGSCPLIRPSDRPNTAAALRPLAVTGGPTPTQALAAGSAAIDGGDRDTCPPLDQRGQARVGTCDIGAHEATAGPCGDGVVDRDEAGDGGAGADPCCSRACAAAVDGSRCTDDLRRPAAVGGDGAPGAGSGQGPHHALASRVPGRRFARRRVPARSPHPHLQGDHPHRHRRSRRHQRQRRVARPRGLPTRGGGADRVPVKGVLTCLRC
ncbi:MAG TPA: right-handed parallel beta-helix repeat-containing protein [Candidatus Dormibacteraeota bacterium]|nr:right-handed parallel beta-helix repeat-containing protein [Candidatus Dormibacteraeota bacterium]